MGKGKINTKVDSIKLEITSSYCFLSNPNNAILPNFKGELNPKIKFVLFERILKITE